jgi:sarcosine oxidase delta subunit
LFICRGNFQVWYFDSSLHIHVAARCVTIISLEKPDGKSTRQIQHRYNFRETWNPFTTLFLSNYFLFRTRRAATPHGKIRKNWRHKSNCDKYVFCFTKITRISHHFSFGTRKISCVHLNVSSKLASESRLRTHHSCKSVRFKQLIRDSLSA